MNQLPDASLLQKIKSLADRFDAVEAIVQAFLPEDGRFERLTRQAEELIKKYPDPSHRPALFGTLVGVKDIFHTTGFDTHAGSEIPAADLAGTESTAVRILKSNGALIVGKTVTTEFAYFAPGPTRNPHNPGHTPGGSSSGSAAAVASGLCELALGTQTIGSVNRPAAFCGVAGYKPTFDRIPKLGVIPLAGSFDHVGLFAEQVGGLQPAAALLSTDWQAHELTGPIRFGLPTGPYLDRASGEAKAHLENVVAKLKAFGYEVIELSVLTDFSEVYDRHQLVLAAEAARVHAAWYKQHADRYHSKTRDLIIKGEDVSEGQLAEALREVQQYRLQIAAAMTAARIDAFVTPSAPGPAPEGLASTGDPVMNLPWTQAGLPTITIPSGQAANGLPLGTQLVGKWHLDEKLFEISQLVEPLIGNRTVPDAHI